MRTATRVMMALIACGLASGAQGGADKAPRISYKVREALAADEITEFEILQKGLADLEARLKTDGKLSAEELKQLREAVEKTSRWIWGEKADADGAQALVYRLGKNVFAKDSLAAKTQDEELPAAQAKALLRDFHRAVTLRHTLATADRAKERRRAKLRDEFNDILNKYFEVRGPN